MKFDNNIKIGDRFYKTPNQILICEVTDIVKTFSTARNEWNEDVIYLAKLVNGLATNTFDVAKATIVRNRIK